MNNQALWLWLAWRLPRKLVYWCAVRVGAHATQGDYSDTVVPELLVMEALERWDKSINKEAKSE